MPYIPRIGFEWKISVGNVLGVVVMAGSVIAAWYALGAKADNALAMASKVPALEQRLTATETSIALLNQTIEVGRTARLTFQASVVETLKSIEADRREQAQVNAEITSQLAVIVSRLDEQREVLRSSEYYGPFTPGYPTWAASGGVASIAD